ncbi:MAG: Gfo/Idh/MocA family oxidoreductase [Bryobacterales bacterium]|nr:Gfo/Idh/MocA family oxidoreductase [Bryobacterales bacterium]
MKPFAIVFLSLATCAAADLRLGIVGTDTSHVSAFSKILNDPSSPNHIPGAKIVAAFKGGSPDVESSYSRVDKYADELKSKYQVEIVPQISDLCGKVDAILLESVDGRKHLPQMREIVKCGKPVFIDKPLASTLDDALEIARIAKAANVKWFSTSSLRYAEVVKTAKGYTDRLGVVVWGPSPTEPHHQLDLSYYGIHPIEMLFTIMGPGCKTVTRAATTNDPGMDTVTCIWSDGRIGTVEAMRPYGPYGAIVIRPKDVVEIPNDRGAYYATMLGEIIKFFQTGVVPVPNGETLEIFRFMDAAQRSKAAGGQPMSLR